MKPYEETHQTGHLSVESFETFKLSEEIDFGIQIAEDGRIWICINGVAFLRFSPLIKNYGRLG